MNFVGKESFYYPVNGNEQVKGVSWEELGLSPKAVSFMKEIITRYPRPASEEESGEEADFKKNPNHEESIYIGLLAELVAQHGVQDRQWMGDNVSVQRVSSHTDFQDKYDLRLEVKPVPSGKNEPEETEPLVIGLDVTMITPGEVSREVNDQVLVTSDLLLGKYARILKKFVSPGTDNEKDVIPVLPVYLPYKLMVQVAEEAAQKYIEDQQDEWAERSSVETVAAVIMNENLLFSIQELAERMLKACRSDVDNQVPKPSEDLAGFLDKVLNFEDQSLEGELRQIKRYDQKNNTCLEECLRAYYKMARQVASNLETLGYPQLLEEIKSKDPKAYQFYKEYTNYQANTDPERVR